MDEELRALERKIAEARGHDPYNDKRITEKRRRGAGAQAGMEFVLCIALAAFAGYHLDQWLGTLPIFLILLFFLGVAAGFWCLYKYANNLGSAVGYSVLHGDQKDANKAPEKPSGTDIPLE